MICSFKMSAHPDNSLQLDLNVSLGFAGTTADLIRIYRESFPVETVKTAFGLSGQVRQWPQTFFTPTPTLTSSQSHAEMEISGYKNGQIMMCIRDAFHMQCGSMEI